MIRKIFILLSIITSYAANAGTDSDGTISNWKKSTDPAFNPIGDNEIVLQFSDSHGIKQFFQENTCINGDFNEIQFENDVVVDLSDCDVIDVSPDVEILAAGNLWDSGTIL